MQESNGTAHLKLVALLDNRPVMRIFERVRSVFALPTRMTGKSSMSKESTRDAQVASYHPVSYTHLTLPTILLV